MGDAVSKRSATCTTTSTRSANRREQIRGVIESTAGMYGDLQGIAGKTLQWIDGLDGKMPPAEAKAGMVCEPLCLLAAAP